MAERIFLVALKDGRSEYSYHEEHFGPFSSKAHVMGEAVAAASEAGRAHGHARVVATNNDGHIYTVWTYSTDAPSWILK